MKRVRNALCLALYHDWRDAFVSCSPKEDPLPVDPDTSITITDHLGRTVELPGPPKSNRTTTKHEYGCGSRRERIADRGLRQGHVIRDIRRHCPRNRNRNPDWEGKEPNIETVISVEPDSDNPGAFSEFHRTDGLFQHPALPRC